MNYLALDRVDLQFAAGVLGRTAANPTARSWSGLKRVAGYFVSHPRIVYRFDECEVGDAPLLIGYSDSDWAGFRSSRRSVSGGMISMSGALVKAWSSRQATVALSSAEAELYALIEAPHDIPG